MKSRYQIFISYRRLGGDITAHALYDKLTSRGYRVAYDIDTLTSGKFNEQIYDLISQSDDIVVVLSEKSLDRCLENNDKTVNYDDWFRREISYAISHKKNIIPVMLRGFKMPQVGDLPQDIQTLPNYHGIEASGEHFDASCEKLYKMLKSKPTIFNNVFKYLRINQILWFILMVLLIALMSIIGFVSIEMFKSIKTIQSSKDREIQVQHDTIITKDNKNSQNTNELGQQDIQEIQDIKNEQENLENLNNTENLEKQENQIDNNIFEENKTVISNNNDNELNKSDNEIKNKKESGILIDSIGINQQTIINELASIDKHIGEKDTLSFLLSKSEKVYLIMKKIHKGKFLYHLKDDFTWKQTREETINNDFYLGIYVITQKQYEIIMNENPSPFKKGDDYPVTDIDFNHAKEFCEKLNSMFKDYLPQNYYFDLPSDIEWEYAAKCNTNTQYSGDDDIDVVGWYRLNSINQPNNTTDKPEIQPVGKKKANQWGLYDMCGNVWEWSYDVETNDNETKIIQRYRGGSYIMDAKHCDIRFRNYNTSERHRSPSVGFRVALKVRNP